MKRLLLDELPIFADDAAIGQALLGTVRADEWPSLVPLFEREGFPRIDPIMRGRYVPAIKAFFDCKYGLSKTAPTARNGAEKPDRWNERKRRD
jgi:hypothetical protein